jgi:hypothetical protein
MKCDNLTHLIQTPTENFTLWEYNLFILRKFTQMLVDLILIKNKNKIKKFKEWLPLVKEIGGQTAILLFLFCRIRS